MKKTLCSMIVGLGALALMSCATAWRDPGQSGTATADDHGLVIQVVDDLFTGMRMKDEPLLRSAFAEEIFIVTLNNEGGRRVRSGGSDSVVASFLNAPGELDERMWTPEVRVDGDLATLWAPYDFHIDGEFSHCGYDAFQLARHEDGWRIVSIAYTRVTEGCPANPDRRR